MRGLNESDRERRLREQDELHAIWEYLESRMDAEHSALDVIKGMNAEIERLRALLKYARLHTAQGWYADRKKEKWLADIDAALRGEGK